LPAGQEVVVLLTGVEVETAGMGGVNSMVISNITTRHVFRIDLNPVKFTLISALLLG
jgi:hypothetical protein